SEFESVTSGAPAEVISKNVEARYRPGGYAPQVAADGKHTRDAAREIRPVTDAIRDRQQSVSFAFPFRVASILSRLRPPIKLVDDPGRQDRCRPDGDKVHFGVERSAGRLRKNLLGMAVDRSSRLMRPTEVKPVRLIEMVIDAAVVLIAIKCGPAAPCIPCR